MSAPLELSGIRTVFFSPTGGVRKLVTTLAQDFAQQLDLPIAKTDFTLPQARETSYEFSPSELVLFASPTYAGKLPNKLLPYISSGFVGNGAPAVALIGFGNRSFDNALAELVSCLEGDGFSLVGAGAFSNRHAFSQTLAADRPDEADLSELNQFACAIADVVRGKREATSPLDVPGDAEAPYYRPIGLDGEPTVFLKAKPVTDMSLCDQCGLCPRRCPMAAIDFNDVSQTPGTCIKCHACVRLCPQGAKSFEDPAFLSHRGMLERDYQRRAEPVWFV
ncbi:MAG: 4Fe-4S dicluster domain-containing protein [Atopobiaceae bacterium]|nr:4Fe-4S dicluster domain-containing protein [Atopobiaceae bacterium]